MQAPSPGGNGVDLRLAECPADVAVARELFLEYAASLNVSLCFQGFDAELAGLPGCYAKPDGRLLLAWVSGEPAGCVGMRKLDETTCEMKRLYVRPRFRESGIGRRLASFVIAETRIALYQRMRLDTLASMQPAISLYERLGFKRVDPYCHNPSECALFFELHL